MVHYRDEPAELRRKSDGTLVETLAGTDAWIDTGGEESPFLVVKYYVDEPDELRRMSDGTLVETLARAVDRIDTVDEDFPFLVVHYWDGPDELRRKSDGARVVLSVEDTWFDRQIEDTWFDRQVASNYFFLRRPSQHTELWRVDPPLRLANLGLGVPWEGNGIDSSSIHFTEEEQTLAIRYEDGRAYLLDLAWLAAAQGDDSPPEVACMPFHSRSLEATIRSKLAEEEYLGDREEPQACSPEGASGVQQIETIEPTAQSAN